MLTHTPRVSQPRQSPPPDEPGRILGVDPGSRRIGLAVSDPGQSLASPHRTLTRAGEAPAELVLAEAHDLAVVRIVVGWPLRLDGSRGPEAVRAEAFAQALRDAGAPLVVLWDERLTSSEAQRKLHSIGRRKGGRVIDHLAAAVLLQRYLDAHASDAGAQ